MALYAGMLITLGASSVSAGTPPVNTTGSVSCSGIVGSLKFTPALTITGGSFEAVKVKVKATGCNAATSNVTTGNFTGKITGTISTSRVNCDSFFATQNVSGLLTVKWSAKVGKSKTNPTSIGLFQIVGTTSGSNGNAGLRLVNQATRGSFSDASIGGEIDANQSAGQIAASCSSKRGLKKLTLDAGSLATSAPAPPPPLISTHAGVTGGSNGDVWFVVVPSSQSANPPTGTILTSCNGEGGSLGDSGAKSATLASTGSGVSSSTDYFGIDDGPGVGFGSQAWNLVSGTCAGDVINYSGDASYQGFTETIS